MLYDKRWDIEAKPLFDLSIPSLRALSYALRHRECWPKTFEWNYSDCNTCAMGLSVVLWKQLEFPCRSTMQEAFGITREDAELLFLAPIRRTSYEKVTPEMVANRIDEFVGARSPQESGA